MQHRLLLASTILSLSAATCMAQITGVSRETAVTPDRREVSTPASFNNTRNESYLQPIRQESTTNERIATNDRISTAVPSRNDFNANGHTPVADRNDFISYERGNSTGYPATKNTNVVYPASNNYVNPGTGTVGARYSPTLRKYYYYCTSDRQKHKCRSIWDNNFSGPGGNVVAWTRPDGTYSFFPNGGGIFTPNMYYFCRAFSRDAMLVPDNTTERSNSSQFFSFDGAIVYNSDTISGIVTITHNAVSLEQPVGRPSWENYNALLKDPKLKAIVVYKGPKELRLVRLGSNKHLSRIVHNGKLKLYDRSYNFLTATNISRHLQARDPATGSITDINSTQQLAETINKTYNLNIDPKSTTREDMIVILNRLD